MSRRKTPAEKKMEFIQVAEELFLEKGYENTSVDDIVKKMGAAKGLFYYYFDSKDDVILAISEMMFEEITKNIEQVMEHPGLSALERFQALGRCKQFARKRSQFMKEFFHQERNRNLHFAMDERANEVMVPVFERIIRQGIDEGIFSTPYPRETAQALLSIFSGLGHRNLHDVDQAEKERIFLFLQLVIERLLAAPPGTFADMMREASVDE
jgi:AcrR family transcriptional regulator